MRGDRCFWGHMSWMALLVVCCLGCLPSSGSRLIGRWEGQLQPAPSAAAGSTSSAGEKSGSVMEIHTDVSAVRVLLDCEATRFTMTLQRPDGSSDRRSGRWSVLESRGSRWLVEFAAEDAGDPIQLRIVFGDVDEFAARELVGDDRLGAWSFRRLSVADASGESAKPTDERD